MKLLVIFVLFQILNTWRVTCYTEPASNSEREQRRALEELFKTWARDINPTETLKPMLNYISKNREKNPCPKSIIGLSALLEKFKREFDEVKTNHTNAREINSTAVLVKVDKIKKKCDILGEEAESEVASRFLNEFRGRYQEFNHKITNFSSQLKDEEMTRMANSLMANIGRQRNREEVLELKSLATPDLERLLRKVVDDMAPNRHDFIRTNFVHIVWALEKIGTDAPQVSQILTELVLDKLKSFYLLPTAQTLQLASISHTNAVPEETKRKFPSQIYNLFWGGVQCLKNEESSLMLREKDPRSLILADASIPMEVTNVNVTDLNCGWHILPIGGSSPLQFNIERKVRHPDRIWRFISNPDHDGIFLSSVSTEPWLSWEIFVTKAKENHPGEVAFELRTNGEVQKYLCHRTLTRNGGVGQNQNTPMSSARSSGEVGLETVSGSNCRWILSI